MLIDPDDVSLEGLGEAMQGLADGRIAGKVMVVPGAHRRAPTAEEQLMAHPYYPSGNPRFNHVALSVPPELLDETNRADICRFWGRSSASTRCR